MRPQAYSIPIKLKYECPAPSKYGKDLPLWKTATTSFLRVVKECANQMQTLHMQIEGSSKFVPTTPGRHIVTEVDNVVALNSATYKVDHSVRFVLLDDGRSPSLLATFSRGSESVFDPGT